MGSFIYMLQNKDTMIDETKRLELEQRLETVFNEAGMMGLSQMTCAGVVACSKQAQLQEF